MRALRFTELCCFICLCIGVAATSYGQIPERRLSNWSGVGAQDYYSFETEHRTTSSELGLDPNGVEDSHAALQNYISAHAGEGVEIFLEAGSYRLSQTLQLTSKLRLIGAGAEQTELLLDLQGQGHGLFAQGQIAPTTFPLSAPALRGSTQVLSTAASEVCGMEWLLLTDDDEEKVTSNWALGSTAQMVRIEDCRGDTIFLSDPLRRNFYPNRQASVRVMDPLRQIEITQLGLKREDDADQQWSNIRFDGVTDSRISCLSSQYCYFSHIELLRSSRVSIEECRFDDALDHGGGGRGYGVVLHFSTGQCLVMHNHFNRLRHSLLLQAGANGNVLAYNFSENPYWTDVSLPANSAGDLVLHGNYPYANLMEGNIVQNAVIDASHGINGPGNTFFRNRMELYGLFIDPTTPTDSLIFVGNEVTNRFFIYGLWLDSGTGHFQYGNRIKGDLRPNSEAQIDTTSLFLSAPPELYASDAWPLIGPPRVENENINWPEEVRDLSAESLCLVGSTSLPTLPLAKQAALFAPNPCRGMLHFVPEGLETQLSTTSAVEIYHSSGKLQYRGLIRQGDGISTHHWPTGVYFAIIQKDKTLLTQTLLRLE
jgi:hypothetical protein